MKPRLFACRLFSAVACVTSLAASLQAQKMPREDVVDVPAISEGLCVSKANGETL